MKCPAHHINPRIWKGEVHVTQELDTWLSGQNLTQNNIMKHPIDIIMVVLNVKNES